MHLPRYLTVTWTLPPKICSTLLLMPTVPIIHELYFKKRWNQILLQVSTPLDHHLLVDLLQDNALPLPPWWWLKKAETLLLLITIYSFLIFIANNEASNNRHTSKIHFWNLHCKNILIFLCHSRCMGAMFLTIILLYRTVVDNTILKCTNFIL